MRARFAPGLVLLLALGHLQRVAAAAAAAASSAPDKTEAGK